MINNSRELALQTLTFFDKNGYVPFKKVEIALSTLSVIDRAFCMNLIFQTLRNRNTIDHILKRYLTKPGKIPAGIMNVLRIGVSQLFYIDSVPDYATINSTVDLVGVKSFRGLVNAVLRRIKKDNLTDIAYNIKLSHPAWLNAELLKIPGISETEFEALLEYNLQQPDETYEFIGETKLLDENGYIYTESDYSSLLTIIEKGKEIKDLIKTDETEWLLKKAFSDLIIVKPETTHSGRINEKPWLLHNLTPEKAPRCKEKILQKIREDTSLTEFIYYSDSILLDETTRVISELKEFEPISIIEFLENNNLNGKTDGTGFWLLPPAAPQAAYISRLRRKKTND